MDLHSDPQNVSAAISERHQLKWIRCHGQQTDNGSDECEQVVTTCRGADSAGLLWITNPFQPMQKNAREARQPLSSIKP
jgi:hypothetical protein